MSQLAQHIVVLVIVLACIGAVAAGLVRTLWGRRSQLGKCCSKGCGDAVQTTPAESRVHFLPADALRVRKPK